MNAYVPKGRTIHRVKVPRQGSSAVNCSTGTRDRMLARKMEAMVRELGPKELRAWDILEAVTARRVKLSTLWDWWVTDGRDVAKVRARLSDTDLAPKIEEWIDAVRLRAGASHATHMEQAVRTLLDAKGALRRSALTAERLRTWLASRTMTRYELVKGKRVAKQLPLSTGSARRYYAALSSFLAYLRTVGAVQGDLLLDVPVPKPGKPRDRHLETAEALDLANAQPEPFRTLSALMAGTGMEVSAALALRVADVDQAHEEIHARGTKSYTRDRIVKVATWAWPFVVALVEGKRARDLLFPGVDRWQVREAHAAACEKLEIRDYTARDHRHTWAVRAVRSGTPIELVARQLGHKDGTLALRVYGRYVPRSDERERWERAAAAMDAASGTREGTR